MALPQWSQGLSLATPSAASDVVSGLSRLPAEWEVVDRVALEDMVIDHVVVGPNGVFTIVTDPDGSPADIREDGLYRDDKRVTTPVKTALMAANELRARVGSHLFAYPWLATVIHAERTMLARLGVVPGDRIAEAIWSHPGRPLRRSSRLEASWALHSLTI